MAVQYNNPGNIRAGQGYAGETGKTYKAKDGSEYVIFDTPEMGLRAMFLDLRSKTKEFDGDLMKMIQKYAPEADGNDPVAYHKFVSDKIGKTTVTSNDLTDVVKSFILFENTKKMASNYIKPELLSVANTLSQDNTMPQSFRLSDALDRVNLPQKQEVTPTASQKPDSPITNEQAVALAQAQIEKSRAVGTRAKIATGQTIIADRVESQPQIIEQVQPKDVIPNQDEVPIIEEVQTKDPAPQQEPVSIIEEVTQEPTQDVVQEELPITDNLPQKSQSDLDIAIEAPSDIDTGAREKSLRDADTPSLLGKKLIKPSVPLSFDELQRVEKDRERRASSITTGDAVDAAIEEDWISSWALSGKKDYEPDPTLEYSKEQYADLTKGLPEDYHKFLEDAVSLPHATNLRERALKSYENDQKLSSLGWGGIGIRMGVAIADPVGIGVSIATEGALAPAVWGNKVGRLGRAIRSGTAAATTNAAIEAYLVSQNSVKDPYDVLYAAGAGFLLGGGIGAITGGRVEDPFNDGMANLAKVVDDAQAEETAIAINNKVVGERLDEASGTDTSVGAAENPLSRPVQVPDVRSDMDSMLDKAGDPTEASASLFGFELPKGASKFVRFDMTGYLLNSDNKIANYLGRIMGEDSVGFRKDGTRRLDDTADLNKTMSMKSSFALYYRVYDGSYKEWAKSQGHNFWTRTLNTHRREFGELVADAIENPDLPVSDAIRRAANRQAEIKRDLLREAKELGVEGFEDIPENLSYFSHLWDNFKYNSAINKYDFDVVVSLLKDGLVRGTENMPEEVAQSIARGMVKKMHTSAAGLDTGASRLFTTDQRDVMRSILIDEDYMDEVEADRILSLFDVNKDGTPARAKRRLRFDMNTEKRVYNKQTNKEEVLRLKDLQERDAEQVFTSYASQMAGRIGFAKVGIKSERQFKQLLDRNLAEAFDRDPVNGRTRAEKENFVAETMFNMIIGRSAPLAADPSGTYARSARLVQDYNFVRLMNQVGFAQVAELGNALSIDGVRGLMQAIPEMRRMLRRAKNGELEDEVINDMEAFSGSGSDRLTNQAMNKADTIGVFSEGRGDWIDKSLFFMAPVKRAVADISGMAPITLALERAAVRMAVQRLTNLAMGTGKKLSLERLAGLGLDEKMAQKIYDNIRTHGTTEKSSMFRNRKIKATNLAKWDPDARSAFLVAVNRWTRRSIQQNDVGNLNLYMTSTMGAIITQFRTFMLVSWGKQFLHGMKANDFAGYQAMMGSMFFASLSYMAQTQLNAQFRDDKEEFLKERLSVSAIGKAGFQRSSWASLFPALVDTGAGFFTDDPIFAYRSSGLDTNLVKGIPSLQALSTGLSTIQAGTRAALNPDLQWSQGQQRAANTLVPLQNAVIIKNALNKLVELQPKYSTME